MNHQETSELLDVIELFKQLYLRMAKLDNNKENNRSESPQQQ